MYVSGIHTGIQAGHAAEEMWVYYTDLVLMADQRTPITVRAQAALGHLREFGRNHKTWILLNGGGHPELEDLASFFAASDHNYPMSSFREPGLNYAITAVRIVVPERLCDDVSKAIGKDLRFDSGVFYLSKDLFQKEFLERKYTAWEVEFLYRKALCRLAS